MDEREREREGSDRIDIIYWAKHSKRFIQLNPKLFSRKRFNRVVVAATKGVLRSISDRSI